MTDLVERLEVPILRGVGKIDGDGWKDTTRKGQVVFVWNVELPSPYSPGQYPRVGNEVWSASTEQYDFAPATASDCEAIQSLLTGQDTRIRALEAEVAALMEAVWKTTALIAHGMKMSDSYIIDGERVTVEEVWALGRDTFSRPALRALTGDKNG